MRASVTVGSEKRYVRQFNKWRAFLATVKIERRPQLFLQDVNTEEQKAKWIALFIVYLGEHGVRGPRHVGGGVLSGLKFHRKANGIDDTCLESQLVKQA